MTLKELKKWKCRAEKCVEIYKNSGKDTSTAKVTIPVNKFLDLTDTAINASSQQEKAAEWYEADGCEGACEGYMSAGVICSQCGEMFCGYISNYDFCPNCGARMVETQESKDTDGINK